ncbi:MAG: hypothetical protein ACREA0_02635 [bacterium]
MSQDFEAFYQHRASEGPEPTLDPLVLSEDGKGIVMRKEDLREGDEARGGAGGSQAQDPSVAGRA